MSAGDRTVERLPNHRVSVEPDGSLFRAKCSACGILATGHSESSAIGVAMHHAEVAEYEDDRRRDAENLGGIL